MEVKKTERGFSVIKFVDRNGKASSLQKSSLAFENAVWLGCDDIEVKCFVPGKGWTAVVLEETFPQAQGIVANNRMHLTQETVLDLLPHLQRFAMTGELKEDTPAPDQPSHERLMALYNRCKDFMSDNNVTPAVLEDEGAPDTTQFLMDICGLMKIEGND